MLFLRGLKDIVGIVDIGFGVDCRDPDQVSDVGHLLRQWNLPEG